LLKEWWHPRPACYPFATIFEKSDPGLCPECSVNNANKKPPPLLKGGELITLPCAAIAQT
jgi:hypothetical protein